MPLPRLRLGESTPANLMTATHSDLSHTTCLVTGASRGIGRITAIELARRGADIILIGRDKRRTEDAALAAKAAASRHGVKVSPLVADLSSLEELKRVADIVLNTHQQLHVLINNAGAIFDRHTLSVDGVEKTFALNHLAYFALTLRLLPLLRATEGARIINVASRAHEGAQMNFSRIVHGRPYHPWRAYQTSKLANILFTRQLATRIEGMGITANALHPGLVATHFGHDGARWMSWLLKLARPWMIDEQEGAKTTLYLASDAEPGGINGAYWSKCQQVRPSKMACEPEAAQRLWQLSVSLTGLDTQAQLTGLESGTQPHTRVQGHQQ